MCLLNLNNPQHDSITENFNALEIERSSVIIPPVVSVTYHSAYTFQSSSSVISSVPIRDNPHKSTRRLARVAFDSGF